MQTVSEIPTLVWESVTLDACLRYRALPLLSPSADYAAANLYMWDEKYRKQMTFFEGLATVRIRRHDGGYRYLFPTGKGDPAPFLQALWQEAKSRGEPLRLFGVTEPELLYLVSRFGEDLPIAETRDFADYLYDAEKLSTLSGKKLHGKRNHINAFSAAHEWYTQPLTPAQFDSCREILSRWQEGKEGTDAEARAIERGFEAWEALSLDGLLLFADGAPVAFAVGSRITNECFCVHFEKALPLFEGVYPVINREFVRAVREKYPELALINREDDMGLENLRAAKLSWRPLTLLKKFDVTIF